MGRRQAQIRCAARRGPARRPARPATRRRSPRSRAPARRAARPPLRRPPPGWARARRACGSSPARPCPPASATSSSIAARALPSAAARPTARRSRRPESDTAAGRAAGPSNSENTRSRGHEHLVGDGVVAAGAAQAQRVPGVEDLAARSLGSATTLGTGRSPRRPPRLDEAAGEQQVGVGDPAAERPPAGHHDAAVDGAPCRAGPHAGGDLLAHRRTARRGSSPGGSAASRLLVIAIDTHQPADASPRAISSAHAAPAAAPARGLDLARCPGPQQARVAQRATELIGEPSAAFGLDGQLPAQRRDVRRHAHVIRRRHVGTWVIGPCHRSRSRRRS